MKTLGSFQNVINAVDATGIGFKKFMFIANMAYDELIDDNFRVLDFPKNYGRDGTLIIKFSDGNSFIGSIAFTHEEFSDFIDDPYGTVPISFILRDFQMMFGIEEEIYMELEWDTLEAPINNSMMGEAFITISTRDHEKYAAWFKDSL